MTLAFDQAQPGSRLALDLSASSHSGMVRVRNQDSWAIDADNGLLLVADGVGGQGDGSWASHRAVSLMQRYLRRASRHARPQSSENRERIVRTALKFCSVQMNRQAVPAGSKRSGSTLVGFWAPPSDNHGATVFNIGDSSLFRITAGAILKISHDHSLHQLWVDGGKVGTEPSKRVITQALGISLEIHPHVTSFALAAGDTYVACTDGLTGALSGSEIWKSLRLSPTASDGTRTLLQDALHHLAQDNVTAAVCKVRSL